MNADMTQAHTPDPDSYAGQLLIAMPGMQDPRFEHAVILMCAHSDEGAMGLIVNKPSQDLSFDEMAKQLSIDVNPERNPTDIHFGGPVENARGFVLHGAEYHSEGSTLEVDGGFFMTTSIDILEDIARGAGPVRSLLALGYSGWGPGQLEDEMGQNGWLLGEASHRLIFETPNAQKWSHALRSIGIDPLSLSASAGRA